MKAKHLQYTVLVVFVALLALAFFQSKTHGDIQVVVLNGQPAPGFTGGRFGGFGGASVNASGDMAFGAGVNVGGVQSAGIFAILAGVLTPIALEGQPLPDGSGRNFGGAFGPAQINDNGAIVFNANFTGTSNYRGIFEYSGGTLWKVVDQSTPVPGMPGAIFAWGPPTSVLINNSGEIAFAADILPPGFSGATPSGIFIVSQGVIQTVFTTAGFTLPFSLNNKGDIAFGIPNNGISIYSGGTITQVATVGQGVPNSNLVVPTTPVPAINDAKDIVFLTYGTGCCSGRGGLTSVPNAIARWRAGALEKIVAAGDTVPGFSGAAFDTTFGHPTVNLSGIAFTGSTVATSSQPAMALVGEIRNGQLIVAAKQNDLIPGLGVLTHIFPGATQFDDQQGPIITFMSETIFGPGVFAAASASHHLQFPQIANGTAAGGGWVTTILLANRSSSASSATVTFYGANGAPMNVSIDGQQVTEVSLTVPAFGVAQFQTDGTGSLAAGWADVQSDQPLYGTALFGFLSSSGSFVSQVGAPGGTPLRALSVFARSGAGISTGVALANPNPAAANVTLTLVDSNSNSVATASALIPANGHLAEYIGEMFGSIALGNFQGKLNIVSTQPLIGLTLLQQGTLFTSLPIIP